MHDPMLALAEAAGAATMEGVGDFGLSGNYASAAEFMKAIQSNVGTTAGGSDIALLTGGAALREQSLEPTLFATIEKEEHFVLFNSMVKGKADSVLHEWSRQTSTGWYEGQTVNGELEDIAESQGEYERKFDTMAFLMTMFQVSIAAKSQKNLVDVIAREKMNATRRIKADTEWHMIYGNRAVNKREFDGIITQILAHNDPSLILDARGHGLSDMGEEIIRIGNNVHDMGHFGRSTDFYCSVRVGSDEFDQKLHQSVRVGLDGTTGGLSTRSNDIIMGTTVGGVKTQYGVVRQHPDIFIRESQPPFDGRTGIFPSIAANSGLGVPTAVDNGSGGAPAVANSATSQFADEDVGLYYYGVESIGKGGRSTCVKSAQVNVTAAGQKVTVVITNPADSKVTGFAVHRSRRNGTNASADLREMVRIPRAAGATTTYVDENQNIPGTSPVLVLNQAPEYGAIQYTRLYPLMLLPLFRTRTAADLAAVISSGFLQVTLPEQHGIIKNVLSKTAAAQWNPRG